MPSERGRVQVAVLIIAVVIVCMLQSTVAQYQNQCRTPDQRGGICVTVSQCPRILGLLNQPLLTSNVVRFLEASRCGILEKKILVCCEAPENTIPANAQPPVQTRPPATTNAPFVQTRLPATTTFQQTQRPVQTQPPFQQQPQRPAIGQTTVGSRLSYEDRLRLLPADCGIQYSDRIIGGERAQIDEYPWIALIQHRRKNGDLKFHCGGTLINQRYVVTAAHCINSVKTSWTLTNVRLGEWDLESTTDCSTSYGEQLCADPVQDIPIEKAIVHPSYTVTRMLVKNDIALLRLMRLAQFNDYVQPICLPLAPAERSISYDGKRFVVAGWGQTEDAPQSRYKLFVGVSGVPEQACRAQYPEANIDQTQVCAGGTLNKDSCRGDSGGPLMYVGQSNGQGVLFLGGVVSFGKRCGLEGVPGVYTRVNQYIEWIVSNLEP
uniref:CLIP domain-containing serine protease n=1 Tax=Anopheles stephensi TaxID=30069 RepID=A0A182YKD4_ANOST